MGKISGLVQNFYDAYLEMLYFPVDYFPFKCKQFVDTPKVKGAGYSF